MRDQRALVSFLRALLAAKKSLNLYPPGSQMATAWVQRFLRSIEDFVREGLTFPIRVGRDRFLWAGEDLLAVDPALEALRVELQVRGIAEFSIDPVVEEWELEAFFDLLNQPPEQLVSIAGAPAYLRERGVAHVSLGTPGIAGLSGAPEHLRTGGVGATTAAGGGATLPVAEAENNALDLFVEAVLERVDERLTGLTYDRAGLLEWFRAIANGGRLDILYSGVKMLGAMAEGCDDREVRTRTMLEALLLLPEATLRPFLAEWLVPLAGSDLTAFNLLTQVTEDELAEIARHVPREELMTLTTELLEFPWEEGKRQRLLEAITWTLQRRDTPEGRGAPAALLSRRDPLLLELREEIIAASRPDVLLEKSADVLLGLIFNIESDDFPGFAFDAVEEILGETLARGSPDLALRILRSLGANVERGGEASPERSERIALLRRKAAGRTHVSAVAGLLRQGSAAQQIDIAAEYLRLVAQGGTEEFIEFLADERDRRVRMRMCGVLARVGPAVIPVLLARLEDKRWIVVRNVLYTLGRIGHPSTFVSVVAALDHRHPRVRLEAVRTAALIAGAAVTGPLLRYVQDPDPAVRRAVIRSLGAPGNDEAVPALRDMVLAPVKGPDDEEVKAAAIRALVSIGTPLALKVLEKIASRRVWVWERAQRQVRGMAAEALSGLAAAVTTQESKRGK